MMHGRWPGSSVGSAADEGPDHRSDHALRWIGDPANAVDEAILGHRFDVLTLGIIGLTKSGSLRLDLDVRRQASTGTGHGHDDHQASSAGIHLISRHHHCGSLITLLVPDGSAEVDEPDVALSRIDWLPCRCHSRPSRNAGSSPRRSSRTASHSSGFSASRRYPVSNDSQNRARS